jgi:hypothetical protein
MTAARTGVPSAVPDLRRLIDDPRSGPSVANLLESAAALLPDVRVALTSPTASELLARGAEWRAGVPSVTRPIHHGATGAGFVAICGEVAPGAREAVARLVASAVEVALAGMAGADAPTPDEQVAREQAAHRLEGELAIGRRIQRSLMPRRFPAIDGWEIAAAYDAAREVGGDLYDAFPLRDRPGCLGIVVADVTGKGIPAALVMADVRALIHAAADHGGGPALTLSRVNKILVTERETWPDRHGDRRRDPRERRARAAPRPPSGRLDRRPGAARPARRDGRGHPGHRDATRHRPGRRARRPHRRRHGSA